MIEVGCLVRRLVTLAFHAFEAAMSYKGLPAPLATRALSDCLLIDLEFEK